jgi:hypothetical protein
VIDLEKKEIRSATGELYWNYGADYVTADTPRTQAAVGFLAGVREICDDAGALMIDDEVQTGMGRTGTWLAIEHDGVKPDIVILAKGIGSGFPMGALVAREGLEFKAGEHGSTFAGGPLASAAALATIRVIGDFIASMDPDVDILRIKYIPSVKYHMTFHCHLNPIIIGTPELIPFSYHKQGIGSF